MENKPTTLKESFDFKNHPERIFTTSLSIMFWLIIAWGVLTIATYHI